jgi:hypothetical protein
MSERLTPEMLDELERLEREATKGRWRAVIEDPPQPLYRGNVALLENGDKYVAVIADEAGASYEWRENARLIAAARNALPALIAAARLLEKAERVMGVAQQWIKSVDQGFAAEIRPDIARAALIGALAAYEAAKKRSRL